MSVIPGVDSDHSLDTWGVVVCVWGGGFLWMS